MLHAVDDTAVALYRPAGPSLAGVKYRHDRASRQALADSASNRDGRRWSVDGSRLDGWAEANRRRSRDARFALAIWVRQSRAAENQAELIATASPAVELEPESVTRRAVDVADRAPPDDSPQQLAHTNVSNLAPPAPTSERIATERIATA